MYSESPLKKKYDKKSVPVRRVSAWEREQIEKRQNFLKERKGPRWQKLHRDDELRKIEAAAEGLRYVRLTSVPSSTIIPKRVKTAARRTRVRILPTRKKNPHKPRENLRSQTTRIGAHNKITSTTYRSPPKRYRYKRPPPPPTPITRQNLKAFRMEEKRRRKERENSFDFEKPTFGHLFQIISTDPTDKRLVRFVSVIEKIRNDRQQKPTDPTLERAEKTLFQLIRQRGDPYDITLQAGTVEALRAANEQKLDRSRKDGEERREPKPIGGRNDGKERHEPAQAEFRRRTAEPSVAHKLKTVGGRHDVEERHEPAQAGPRRGPAEPSPAHKQKSVPGRTDSEERSRPAQTEPRRQAAGPSAAPVPARNSGDRSEPAQGENGNGRDPAGGFVAPEPEGKEKNEQTNPAQPGDGLRQHDNQPTWACRTKHPNTHVPKENTSTSTQGDLLYPPSPPRRASKPALAPKPSLGKRQENKRPGASLDASRRHRQPSKSQASASSLGDALEPSSPPRRTSQAVPASPSHGISQAVLTSPTRRTSEAVLARKPILGQRQHSSRAPSVTSRSSISERFPPPSPSLRGSQPILSRHPSQGHRQDPRRPSTAPEARGRANKRPQSSISSSIRNDRFDSISPPPRSSHASSAASPPPPRGRQLTRSPPPPSKRRRAATPPSPAHYLSSASPSPPPPRPVPLPHLQFKQLTSITDREDKASRKLMHPASAPLRKLPDAAREAREDFERVGRLQQVHPSFVKGKGNVNMKHVRHVNRAGGRGREVVERERSVWKRLGGMRGAEGLRGRVEVGGGVSVREGGGEGGPTAGVPDGGLMVMQEGVQGVVGGERELTIEEMIEAEYGPGGGGLDEEEEL